MQKMIFFIGGIIGIILSVIFRGGEWLSFQQEIKDIIFWQIRLPRMLLSFICGSSLSMAGLIFQSLFRNDLASPYTLGVASGASFGASLFLWAGLSFTLHWGFLSFDTITLGAFLGSMLCVFIILSLSKIKNNKSPHFLILAGVMISFLFSSAIMLLQFLSKEMGLQKMIYWLMGDLNIVGMDALYLLYPVTIIIMTYIFFKRDLINILSMGDRFAKSKGIDATIERRKIFIIISILVAFMVSLCGPIGFVGLMVPHIIKKKFGANLKECFLPAIWAGGFFLVWCDFISRNIFSGISVPIGVVTSFIGGGFFLFLLLQREKSS